ncbi:glycosyltransferase [Aureitalea marina]|uniref:Glycosyltransferase 2-like domain-containing protein n=1 Tax=Aureitalea marina TaxID=930804 RepID=A0A2S7KR35_9FLAO|nr:glycosyltransferase [Aureitalea marina]PQB05089.1 hypothetical protein BST85_09425 [Aureitalea marina]
MKLGVLILCHNNEKEIQEQLIIKNFANLNNLEICLVNNHSSDSTYEKLSDIQEYCKNIYLININKHKSEQAALRAGSRYMFNQSEAVTLGYIPNMDKLSLYQLLKGLAQNMEDILAFLQQIERVSSTRVTKCQEIFEIPLELLDSRSNSQSV